MTSRLVLRVDGHAAIGSGHVMRCLALAQAWRAEGGAAQFVGRIDDAMDRHLGHEGFGVERLRVDASVEDDLAITRRILGGTKSSAVVFDAYRFDAEYVSRAAETADSSLAIDDLGVLRRAECDLVLDIGLATGAARPIEGRPRVLGGPRHALLRRELVEGATRVRGEPPRDMAASRVLFGFGGSDPTNLTPTALDAARRLSGHGITSRCLVGPSHPQPEAMLALGRAAGVDTIVGSGDLTPHYAWADLAVVAAGGTAWEVALFGVPALLVVAADNQRAVAEACTTAGAARLLGDGRSVDASAMAEEVLRLARSPAERAAMRQCALHLVDGGGPRRVVAALRKISRGD